MEITVKINATCPNPNKKSKKKKNGKITNFNAARQQKPKHIRKFFFIILVKI